jgi:hypothetical protein
MFAVRDIRLQPAGLVKFYGVVRHDRLPSCSLKVTRVQWIDEEDRPFGHGRTPRAASRPLNRFVSPPRPRRWSRCAPASDGVADHASRSIADDTGEEHGGGEIGAEICLGLVFTTANLTWMPFSWPAGFSAWSSSSGRSGSIPMDIAPQYAGTGSGLMNTGSAVAAIVSPLAFGLIVDLTGSWVLLFAVSIAPLLLGCAMAFTMHPERRFAEEIPGTATR